MMRETAHRLRRHPHLGFRIIKTGIAVTLCLALCDLLQLQQPFVAVVTAIISMGRSIDNTVRTGKDHLLAAILGAVCGALLYHVSPQNAGLCGIGIILVIFLCQLLQLRRGTLTVSYTHLRAHETLSDLVNRRHSANCLVVHGCSCTWHCNRAGGQPTDFAAELRTEHY